LDLLLILSAAADTPPGRVFGMDAQTFIMAVTYIVNVGVLAFILARLLYRPVREVLQKRTNRIQGQLLQAEEELARAIEMRHQYEQKMEEVEREREDILSEARKAAAESKQRLIADAKKEADAIKDRTEATVKMEWERAENDMRTAIIDVSAVMAEKFVSLAINKETHDRLFDETMKDLEGMTWSD